MKFLFPSLYLHSRRCALCTHIEKELRGKWVLEDTTCITRIRRRYWEPNQQEGYMFGFKTWMDRKIAFVSRREKSFSFHLL